MLQFESESLVLSVNAIKEKKKTLLIIFGIMFFDQFDIFGRICSFINAP